MIKKSLVFGGALLLVSAVVFISFLISRDKVAVTPIPTETLAPQATSSPTYQKYEVIGYSVEGRTIAAYSFGYGKTNLLFVGGIHGGYEWNSSLLAYEMIDYLANNPDLVPQTTTVTIIPDLNPDGTFKVIDKEGRFTIKDIINPNERISTARFNANNIDLNRNFACKWQPTSTWQGREVSAGNTPFSEPEAAALKGVVEKLNPKAVVFWHSKAGAVYGSSCEEGLLPETETLLYTYANAANYKAVPLFDAYPVSGDAEGWLATLYIPAITVELETHNTIEWEKNRAGTMAVIDHYAK